MVNSGRSGAHNVGSIPTLTTNSFTVLIRLINDNINVTNK